MALPTVASLPRTNLLLPVLPLRDVSLFPAASLVRVVNRPANLAALDLGARSGNRLIAVARRDPSVKNPGPRDLWDLGTVAELADQRPDSEGGRRIELDGLRRGRVKSLFGMDTLVAEVELLDEGDPGTEWGGAVEALARYLRGRRELRDFLDDQRRTEEPMAWVNLACQHLPITASARQKLLECDAAERCVKISRGLDALLRKEQAT